MEKVFNKFARRGSVKAHQIQSMMREMHPDFVQLNQDEMNNIIDNVDRQGKCAADTLFDETHPLIANYMPQEPEPLTWRDSTRLLSISC